MSTIQHFQTTLVGDDGSQATGIQVPFNVQEVFGSRAQVPVRGTINCFPYRATLAPMGGCHMMGVPATMRAAMGLKAGDALDVVMERDDEERTVPVPDDLAAALGENSAAQAAWDRLAYSRRKEMARLLTEAKQPETRARRLAKILTDLGGA